MILPFKKIANLFSALSVICMLAFVPTLAMAAEADVQTVDLNKMTDEKRLGLAAYLIENDQADKAIQAIIFKEFTTKPNIITAQTMLAEALFFSGKQSDAIITLRNLLAADPNLTLVRYKLARMLLATDDDLAAKHHFQILRAAIDDEKVQILINHHLSQIDLRKRWFFSVSGNILPQSNINGGSSQDTYYCEDTGSTPEAIKSWTNLLASFGLDCTVGIPISPNEQAQSGVGAQLNMSGGYRFRMSENASWEIRAIGGYTYNPAPNDDVISLALTTGPTIYLDTSTKLNINGLASINIADKAIINRFYSLSATFEHIFNPQILGSATLAVSKLDNLINDDYSNMSASLNGSAQISIDNTSFVRLSTGLVNAKYVEPNLSYWQVRGGLSYYKEFGLGITLFSSLDIAYKMKPLESIVNYNFLAKFTKRDFSFWGFTPQLIYNYNRADSNINRNDTDGHTWSIGLTRSF